MTVVFIAASAHSLYVICRLSARLLGLFIVKGGFRSCPEVSLLKDAASECFVSFVSFCIFTVSLLILKGSF